jgi:hypothetical protein
MKLSSIISSKTRKGTMTVLYPKIYYIILISIFIDFFFFLFSNPLTVSDMTQMGLKITGATGQAKLKVRNGFH